MKTRKPKKVAIPVIDMFAGPGGLGEGFSSLEVDGFRPFKIRLSVEKDPAAHQTLMLRAFFRQFHPAPSNYYRYLRGEITRDELYQRHPKEAAAAADEALCAELGGPSLPDEVLDEKIASLIGKRRDWVLIGGPPCQAYSTAGRSRNRGKADYAPEKDKRHFLYKEYLRLLAVHQPAVFVMENVKGILSSKIKGEGIFQQIILDLTNPSLAFKERVGGSQRQLCYRIHSLVTDTSFDDAGLPTNVPTDFVIESERYGVPQARHRVILLGVRQDLDIVPSKLIPARKPLSVGSVLSGLPRLRAGLSREPDGNDEWLTRVHESADAAWLDEVEECAGSEVYDRLFDVLGSLEVPKYKRGGEFIRFPPRTTEATKWFIDEKLGGVCNSSTRSHMLTDLHRYLYASCFAAVHKRSPLLKDFPKALRPAHENVALAIQGGGNFADRFRVQLRDSPSTTVVSHIAKDGHYYIHYDPKQCRSLTVREAARLQTFKDNYFFCGNRTEQYHQVGNAVPPRLAERVAGIVYGVLKSAKANRTANDRGRQAGVEVA